MPEIVVDARDFVAEEEGGGRSTSHDVLSSDRFPSSPGDSVFAASDDADDDDNDNDDDDDDGRFTRTVSGCAAPFPGVTRSNEEEEEEDDDEERSVLLPSVLRPDTIRARDVFALVPVDGGGDDSKSSICAIAREGRSVFRAAEGVRPTSEVRDDPTESGSPERSGDDNDDDDAKEVDDNEVLGVVEATERVLEPDDAT